MIALGKGVLAPGEWTYPDRDTIVVMKSAYEYLLYGGLRSAAVEWVVPLSKV